MIAPLAKIAMIAGSGDADLSASSQAAEHRADVVHYPAGPVGQSKRANP